VRRLLPLFLVAAAATAGGCGGGDDDKAEVEQVIRDWAKAANEHDADAFCNDLVTQGFAERVSLATGDNARKQCEKLVEATKRGLTIEIIDISKIEVDGDRATAVVRRRVTGSGAGDQVFELKKEDGEFRLDSSGDS
jgi:ketosteroid isomerase-like protein